MICQVTIWGISVDVTRGHCNLINVELDEDIKNLSERDCDTTLNKCVLCGKVLIPI